MPFSTKLWDTRIPPYVEKLASEKGALCILDVWAWAWKRWKLLRDFASRIDAVEIFKPYIEQYSLAEIYDEVLDVDVMSLSDDFFNQYDLIVLWDIFEHLNVEDATKLLKSLKNVTTFVMVPFDTPQWEHYWNIHETHLQPDLSEDTMKERYPQLNKEFVDGRFWFYSLNF